MTQTTWYFGNLTKDHFEFWEALDFSSKDNTALNSPEKYGIRDTQHFKTKHAEVNNQDAP